MQEGHIPWAAHMNNCCSSIPHRPLFPRFAKDCNAASIAIGSNYAKSQQFSWAFFQHSVYCFIQLQPGTLGALVALMACTGCWMAVYCAKEHTVSQWTPTHAYTAKHLLPVLCQMYTVQKYYKRLSFFLHLSYFASKCYKRAKEGKAWSSVSLQKRHINNF